MKRPGLQLSVVLAAALLPLIFVLGQSGVFLADPLSELPVKLWGFATFAPGSGRFLGGTVDTIGFPHAGPLNNPDLVGTLITSLLGPLMGDAMAYNSLVCLLLAANGAAAWALARHISGEGTGAVVSGVAFALTPLALSYGMGGAITDLLNLWPYPLTLLLTLQALRSEERGIFGGWAHGVGAGVVLGLGFTTCVYNFVVFAPMALIVGPWLVLAFRRGMGPADKHPAQPGISLLLSRSARVAGHLGLGFALTGGLYAAFLLGIMGADDSQMSTEMVGAVRHSAPFQELSLAGQDRYVAHLLDYFSTGKEAVVTRDNASRFHWAFHPGWLIYGLALLGVVAHRRRLSTVVLWPAMALMFILLSTGPYLIVDTGRSLSGPDNLLWVWLFEYFPATDMLLEPFRYALVVGMALAVAAGIGAQVVATRMGPWAGYLLAVAAVAETALISPTPVPPPTTTMAPAEAYESLAQRLPEGAIIELPYFHPGTGLFQRRHFLHQLSHGRPIANQVFGLTPKVLADNPLVYALLLEEGVPDRFLPRDQPPAGTHTQGAASLAAQGFTAIVVNPSLYPDRATEKRVRRILRDAGHLEKLESGAADPIWVVGL